MPTSPANGRLLRSGQAIVNNNKVVIGPKSTTETPASDSPIKIHRGENGVESIEVVCACGQTITIRCEYE